MIIHRIPCNFSNAYLVENQRGSILIDTGAPGSEKTILRFIQRLGLDLRLIFITHAHLDHYGSASWIQKQTGAPIAIHKSDYQFLSNGQTTLGTCRVRGTIVKLFLPVIELMMKPEPIYPDRVLVNGDKMDDIGIEAICIHTPGHTPGSSSILFEDGSVFVGDLASSTGQPHLQRYFAHDWSEIPNSAQILFECNPEWIYPGHGKQPISGKILKNLILDFIR